MTSFKFATAAIGWLVLSSTLPTGAAYAQEDSVKTLEQLLQSVRESGQQTEAANRQREREFREQRDRQQAILQQTQAAIREQEARSVELKARFDANELELTELNETLQIRIGDMGELFGVVRQVAGDAKGTVETSLVTAQLPGRSAIADELAGATALPSIADLRELQALLLEEMIESGKSVRFSRTIEDAGGFKQPSEVVRIGVFNAVNENGYLAFDPATTSLRELPRQPAARYLNSAVDYFAAGTGFATLAIDPTPIDRTDPAMFHKTTNRLAYSMRAARHPDVDDVVLVNDLGQITETTIANVAVRLDDVWVTPPREDGLLAGIMRDHLIRSGKIKERSVSVDELLRADAVAVFNSVRGWRTAAIRHGVS